MSGRFRHCFLILVLGMSSMLPNAAVAAPAEDFAKRMDRVLARATAAFGQAGVQAVVIRHGQVLWSGQRGLAITDPPRPVTADTMFAYASLSKLVLAAYALHQVENGSLALDKPISAYIGDTVPGARRVSVRMLLTHTSGYPDLYADPATEPLFPPGEQYDPDRPYTFAMLAKGIRAPVEPGARFAYSNTGYILLGHVLAKLAGGDDALRLAYQNYLRGAGTPQTPITEQLITLDRSPEALRRLAHGYNRRDNGSLQDYFTAYGATGIPTDLYGLPFTDGHHAGTATGVGLVLDGLFARGRLLRPETLRHMVTPSPQAVRNPDFDRSYGMGSYRAQAGGISWHGHGGSYGGFNSMAGTNRARGLTVAVVTNRLSAERPAEVIWRELAAAASS
ncbi:MULTISPECIES: serine hydrolase [unclassified Crossiella]|uniref:serine hydrolase domain-containing protein n=1 Tax=unclassified Crossiella TaxID=2620835 RepID=UPI001FFE8D7F|nr:MULTISPECIES: serine hydrolase domain-containing protein [unclassified Crossiella]MCK2244474.1 beta-lactamase family protein [Crossiella sp. S99.2]MCK2258105.1 beta-lactamase family protein [Crossiella sp. S99.1]